MNLKNIWRQPVLSLTTLMSITAALTVLGLFWMLVENLERVKLEQEVNSANASPAITVFVDSTLDSAGLEKIKTKILMDKMFTSIELVPQAKAIENLQAQFGETLSKLFEGDTLPTTLKVNMTQNTVERNLFMGAVNTLRAIPGVLDVDEGLHGWLASASSGSALDKRVFSWATGLFFIVFLIVALLVSHLMRLAFESFKPEVETLKILGAPKFWIFTPFMIEGFIFGLLGGLFSVGFIVFMVHIVIPKYSSAFLPKGFIVQSLSFASSLELIALGILASLAGAFFTWPVINRPASET